MMLCCVISLLLIPINVFSSEITSYDINKQLFLTPYLKSNLTEEARNLSKVIFNGFEDVISYSGYFTVDSVCNSNSFFWFFPSEDCYLKDPLILWLHGGPGLPSESGLFGESGPFTVTNGTLLRRDHSWTQNHSVLYIDNPVGAGFSFTDEDGYATEETQIGLQLYNALAQFFILFPELRTNEFFLAGGSYAGKYIPAVGYVIHQNNFLNKTHINLKGILLYNALVDPINQVVYGDFLYERGLIEKDDQNAYNALRYLIVKNFRKNLPEMSILLWNILINDIKDNPNIVNIYNYLRNDTYYTLIPDWLPYILQPEIRKIIHVGDAEFNYDVSDPDYKVREYLANDWIASVAPWFKQLLENYRVLLFNGELDVMVPYTSVPNYLEKLNFSEYEQYKNSERRIWRVDGEIAGDCKSAGYLTECVVKDSGHSVPYEKPAYIFDLVYKFVRNVTLYDDDIDNNVLSDRQYLPPK